MTARVAVIGGGIAGLSAANRIRELAEESKVALEVTLLERNGRLGGALETIRRDGFVIETGADSILSEKPWAIDLARRIGLDAEIIPTREEYRKTFVVRGGQLVEIPTGFSLLAPARLGPILRSELFSTVGKLRIALEPFIPARRGTGDESLGSFVTRRLGREVLERVAQPLAGGIYTADPNQLSIAATMPRFVAMERHYGSLIRGLRAAERARASKSRDASGARWNLFVSFKGGVAALVEALAARLSGSIRNSAEVVAMTREGNRWRLELAGGGDAILADAVICAAPAPAAARILSAIAPKAAELLGTISYASAATVNIAYRADDFPRAPAAFGFVVPIAERRKIIAGSFSSFKYEGRAPAGMILARAFVGGVLQSGMMNLSDDEIAAAAVDEFRLLLGVNAAPQFTIVRRWPDSMPQYEVGHLARVAEIERLIADVPSFAAAGAAYRGVGIPDCVRSGEQAAEAVFAKLPHAG
ncbi:MAG TPA: protoporphyrinogen oxidase [Candidatus Binataceae bacterium]|nr:protoporphyrinogen oxidase [Candidatus Binataceae bacterium]